MAGFHLGVHPLQKADQLQLGVKFHKRVLPSLFFWCYCSAEERHLQELSQQTGDILQRQAPLKGQGDAVAHYAAQLRHPLVDVLGRHEQIRAAAGQVLLRSARLLQQVGAQGGPNKSNPHTTPINTSGNISIINTGLR